MVCGLKPARDGVVTDGAGQVDATSAQKSVEQVYHVAVAVGGNEVLGVAASRKLDANVLGGVVLGAKTGLKAHNTHGGVVVNADSRLNEPTALLALVVEVNPEFRGIVFGLQGAAHRVGVLVVGKVADEFQSVLEFVGLAQEVGKVESAIEAVYRRKAGASLELSGGNGIGTLG